MSGAGITKRAKNKANAVRHLGFLASESAQHLYASNNFEHPVQVGIKTHPHIESFGSFNADSFPLLDIAKHRKAPQGSQ